MPQLLKACSGETATVAELIEKLKAFPPDMPVAYLWEGQIKPVVLSEIELEQNLPDLCGPTVLINCET